MSLLTEITAQRRRITKYVLVAGQRVPNLIGYTVDLGMDQWSGQARIKLRSRPSWAVEKQDVECWVEINGYPALLFRGQITGFTWEYWPGYCTIEAATGLEKLQQDWDQADRSWTAADPTQIIRDILDTEGVSYSVGTSTLTVADFQPITLAKGQSIQSFIQSLLTILGWAMWDANDGTTRATRITGNPGPTAVWHAQRGIDILKSQRHRTVDGIYNQAIIDGLTLNNVAIHAEQQAPNSYVLRPSGYIPFKFQSNAIQTQTLAQSVADRTVADRNRRPDGLTLELRGNPLLLPSATLEVTDPHVEAAGNLVFMQHVTHTVMSGYRTSVRTTGGNLAGYDAQAPQAAFVASTFQEAKIVSGTLTPVVVVTCDGATSWSPTGSITRWVWSASTGETQDGTNPLFTIVVPKTTESVTITLTVYDNASPPVASAPLVQTILISGGTHFQEALYLVDSGSLQATTDGEATWQSQAAPSSTTFTGMAPFANSVGQIVGCSNGHVYLTVDNCVSALIDLGAPGSGSCTAVWLHETIAGLAYAAYASGAVYMSANLAATGTTWTRVGTVPEGPVKMIQSSPALSSQLTASAGAHFYQSFDNGATWAILAGGDTAWWAAEGFSTTIAGFLNTTNPAKVIGASSINFSPAITHVRGVTIGWRRKYALFADNGAHIYRSDDFNTAAIVGSTPSGVNHLLRSGNADGVVYAACDDRLAKSADDGANWWTVKTNAAALLMVSYGVVGSTLPPAGVAELLLGLSGAGTSSGIYHGVPNGAGVYTWTLKNSGLPSGHAVQAIKSHPTRKNEWLILLGPQSQGQSGTHGLCITGTTTPALWQTTDNGASFTSITLTLPSGSYSGAVNGVASVALDYTADGGWLLAAELQGVGSLSVGDGVVYWTAAPATGGAYSPTAYRIGTFGTNQGSALRDVAGGATGDGILAYFNDPTGSSPHERIGWWHRAGSITDSSDFSPAPSRLKRSRQATTPRQVVAVYDSGTNTGTTYVTTDYLTSSYTTLSYYGNLFAGLADGSWWFAHNSGSLTKVTNIATSPATSSVTAAPSAVGPTLVSDTGGSALAAFYSASGTKNGVTVSLGGTTWSQPTPPVAGGTFDQVYSSGLEVIVR